MSCVVSWLSIYLKSICWCQVFLVKKPHYITREINATQNKHIFPENIDFLLETADGGALPCRCYKLHVICRNYCTAVHVHGTAFNKLNHANIILLGLNQLYWSINTVYLYCDQWLWGFIWKSTFCVIHDILGILFLVIHKKKDVLFSNIDSTLTGTEWDNNNRL